MNAGPIFINSLQTHGLRSSRGHGKIICVTRPVHPHTLPSHGRRLERASWRSAAKEKEEEEVDLVTQMYVVDGASRFATPQTENLGHRLEAAGANRGGRRQLLWTPRQRRR